MTSLDNLAFRISKGFNDKFPEIDKTHYSPQVIKDYIQKSKINYNNQSGLQQIINVLTNHLKEFRLKINKERQSSGIVDFPNPYLDNYKSPPIPQQNLVISNKIKPEVYNTSRREFLNHTPLVIDSGMVSQSSQNNNIGNNNIGNNNSNNSNNNGVSSNVYLNHIETNNNQRGNYQSFPSQPIFNNNTISSLSNLPQEIETNQTDRFILTDKQRDLLKEDTNEWTYYLVIDSKDRDMSAFPTPNSYTIKFSPPNFNSTDARAGYVDRIFHNVKSIELIKCGFLDTSEEPDSSDSGGNEPPYIMLEIEEFASQHNGTNQFLNKSLAILDTFDKQGNFKYYEEIYNDVGMVNKFNPRVTIDKMTIKFRLPNGELYNFGSANNTSMNTINYLVFRVVVLQRVLETQYLNQTMG